MQDRVSSAPSLGLIFVALTPFGLGYFFSYLYRAVNAVIAPDLVRDIGLSAAELGLLTAAYLLAFALFQLPLGILLDRFGPRRVQAALVALGALGAAMFAAADSLITLAIARAIIGVAFAGGLMSGFKAVVIWVPEPRRALANSCVMSIGAIGLLVATTPTEMAVQALGWRLVFMGLSAITLAVAALIFFVVPERETARTAAGLLQQIREVGAIYSDRVFLALAPVLAISAGAHLGLQTLWVGPWLRDIAGLDRLGVANSLFVMAVAFLGGVLGSGLIADWCVRRGISLITVTMGFVLAFLASQVVIVLEPSSLYLVAWSVFGMTGQAAVLAYPWLSSYFGIGLSGRANTAVNLLMFLAAFIIQYAVGAIIDLFPVTPDGRYDPHAYRVAFGALLIAQLAALAWYAANRRLLRAAEQSLGQAL
jgi:predicted MFS family arabinose efflux permease